MTLTERIAVLQRVADALAAVRAALAPLSADDRKAVLADVLAELDGPTAAAVHVPAPLPPPPAAATPPGKPTPRPPREPTDAAPKAGRATDVRLKLLRLLAAHPDGLTVKELCQGAELADNVVSYNLKHEWFEKSDPTYVRSPWVLSEAGEKAASGLPAT